MAYILVKQLGYSFEILHAVSNYIIMLLLTACIYIMPKIYICLSCVEYIYTWVTACLRIWIYCCMEGVSRQRMRPYMTVFQFHIRLWSIYKCGCIQYINAGYIWLCSCSIYNCRLYMISFQTNRFYIWLHSIYMRVIYDCIPISYITVGYLWPHSKQQVLYISTFLPWVAYLCMNCVYNSGMNNVWHKQHIDVLLNYVWDNVWVLVHNCSIDCEWASGQRMSTLS